MEARLAAVEQAEGGGEKHSAACAQRMPQLRVYQLLIRAMCAMRMHAALTSQGAKQGPQQAGRKSLGGALRACKLLRSTLRRFKGAPGTFDALQARLFCRRSCRRRRCRPAAMLPVVPTACSIWCSSCPCNLHQKCTLLLLNQKSAIMYSRWPLGAGHLDCAQRSQERQHPCPAGAILVLALSRLGQEPGNTARVAQPILVGKGACIKVCPGVVGRRHRVSNLQSAPQMGAAVAQP